MLALDMIKMMTALFIFAVALIAGIFPLQFQRQDRGLAFAAGEALACGIFLGAGMIHMLHHAIELAAQAHIHSKEVSIWLSATFLLMTWLEHIGRHLEDHHHQAKNAVVLMATLILSLHSFASGVALGMAEEMKTFLVVAMAILSHKWAAGFALAMLLSRTMMSKRNAWLWYGCFCCMTPLGIYAGTAIIPWSDPHLSMIASAIATGTFLYVGTLHGLKRAVLVDRCCDLKHFTWVLIGFTLMALMP